MYNPEEKTKEGWFLFNKIKKLYLSDMQSFCKKFSDLGEISPNYHGFKTLKEKFILAASLKGNPCGYCAFILRKVNIIQIDIIVVTSEWRRKGVGKLLISVLEDFCLPGTVLYVDQVTDVGRKFFIGCGFTKDVNLFKIVKANYNLFEYDLNAVGV